MKYLLLFLITFMGCLAKASAPFYGQENIISGFTQGTTYSIKYYSEYKVSKTEIDSVLRELDASLSIYKNDSKISIFNDPNLGKIKMDNHLRKVVEASFKTYQKTNGYFDITVMPLVNLWGFGPAGFSLNPNNEEIATAKSLVGMKNLKLKGDFLVKKKKGISVDVNGIAQGYSVDVLAEFLVKKRITDFIVEIGGEIVAKGTKPNGDFIVEIQRPYNSSSTASYKVKIKNMAITTSGSYEKRIKIGDRFISHHIDPKTGYPIESSTISVTVIASSAMEADAFDNYLMYLTPDKAIQFVENQESMEAYIIYAENNILKELQSSGFNNYIYK